MASLSFDGVDAKDRIVYRCVCRALKSAAKRFDAAVNRFYKSAIARVLQQKITSSSTSADSGLFDRLPSYTRREELCP
jgi:hypothetical protein